ncbi:MAG: hypothetical protein PHE49_04195 [bacterium]|nr:hypothetical protein [bacterium]
MIKQKVLLAGILFFICSAAFAEQDKFTITGEGKIRFKYVEANVDTIKGSYGETLKKGLTLRERIDLSVNVPITEYLKISGTVRISNEDTPVVMLPAPDFVSTKAIAGWLSLSFEKSPFAVTAGSYDASFTPLTFMRWDLNDNPLGATSCACQASVGGISGESLEELQEDYKLEGLKTELSGEFGDITALFAIPQFESKNISANKYMYGARARFVPAFIENLSSASFGVTGLSLKDDTAKVGMSYTKPFQSDVFGFDARIPILWNTSFVAEYARSIRDDDLRDTLNIIRRNNGISGGLQLLSSDKIDVNLLYLQMDPYFAPLYRSLSCAANRRGVRFSFTYRDMPLFSKEITIAGYYKKLKEIEPTWDDMFIPIPISIPTTYDSKITTFHSSLTDFLVANFGITVPIVSNWKIENDYEYRSEYRPDDILTTMDEKINNQTAIVSLILSYEFTMQSKVLLKYQFIDYMDNLGEKDYIAKIPMLQFSFKF